MANFISRAITAHYSNTKNVRSEAEVEADKRIFWGLLAFRRAFVVPVAVITQFCLGSLYSWSVLNKPIDGLIYGNEGQNRATITFFMAVGFFGTAAAVMGPWIERSSPRRPTTVGAALFFIGNMLSAIALRYKVIGLLFVSYGIIGACGLGISYVATASIVQKWYPKGRGLAAGLAVCGFGGGSLCFTKVRTAILASQPLHILFVIEGCMFGFIMLFTAQFLRLPPPGYNIDGLELSKEDKGYLAVKTNEAEAEQADVEKAIETSAADKSEGDEKADAGATPIIKISLIQALTSYDFWILYFIFFANQFFGLVVISRLSNMAQDIFTNNKQSFMYIENKKERTDHAANLVVIVGLFNTFGRLGMATLSDWIGRKTTFMILLGSQICLVAGLSAAMHNDCWWAFLFCAWGAAFFYGGGFGTIPAFLADLFGPYNVSSCHGIILTAWSIGGVAGGLVFTAIYNSLKDNGPRPLNDPSLYTINIYWIIALMALGFVGFVFLRAQLRDRLFPAVPGQLLRIRLFGRTIRVIKPFKVEVLSKAQEDQEWEEYLMVTLAQMRSGKAGGDGGGINIAAFA
ncbi:MFS general substrate transporter [Ramicandelaber brevisporus]|nr:MFS general substrate transporter [Ramicandelaber brevisporus]